MPTVVPRGGGRLLARRGFRRVAEVEAGEEVRIGALRVRATHAEHGAAQLPFRPRVPALGYLIAGSRRVYFAGDTGIFGGMANIDRALDVALVPVGGWGPLAPFWERFPSAVPGHLDPRRRGTSAPAAATRRPDPLGNLHPSGPGPCDVGLPQPTAARLPPQCGQASIRGRGARPESGRDAPAGPGRGHLGYKVEATLAVHPFHTRPNGVDEVVLGVAMEAPHRLVFASPVLETYERPASLGRPARRLPAPSAILAGPEARSVAAGALFALVPEALDHLRGLLRRTRYTCFDHGSLPPMVRASGCCQHRRGRVY